MTRPQPPVLTVRSDRLQRSFAAGRDLVVGSDLHADMRVAHPLAASAHLLLRFEQSNWVAVDNDSPTGMYVDGQRVTTVEIHDGQVVRIGRPNGPRITFEVQHHQGLIARLPHTESPPAPKSVSS